VEIKTVQVRREEIRPKEENEHSGSLTRGRFGELRKWERKLIWRGKKEKHGKERGEKGSLHIRGLIGKHPFLREEGSGKNQHVTSLEIAGRECRAQDSLIGGRRLYAQGQV